MERLTVNSVGRVEGTVPVDVSVGEVVVVVVVVVVVPPAAVDCCTAEEATVDWVCAEVAAAVAVWEADCTVVTGTAAAAAVSVVVL